MGARWPRWSGLVVVFFAFAALFRWMITPVSCGSILGVAAGTALLPASADSALHNDLWRDH